MSKFNSHFQFSLHTKATSMWCLCTCHWRRSNLGVAGGRGAQHQWVGRRGGWMSVAAREGLSDVWVYRELGKTHLIVRCALRKGITRDGRGGRWWWQNEPETSGMVLYRINVWWLTNEPKRNGNRNSANMRRHQENSSFEYIHTDTGHVQAGRQADVVRER